MSKTDWARSGPLWNSLYVAFGLAMVAQVCLLFPLPTSRLSWLVGIGWGVLGVSAVLGWIPVFVLRRR